MCTRKFLEKIFFVPFCIPQVLSHSAGYHRNFISLTDHKRGITCISTSRPFFPHTCFSISLRFQSFNSPSFYVSLSSLSLSLFLPLCLCVSLSLSLSLSSVSVCLNVCMSVCPYVRMSICLYVCMSLSLSLSLSSVSIFFLPVYLSFCFTLVSLFYFCIFFVYLLFLSLSLPSVPLSFCKTVYFSFSPSFADTHTHTHTFSFL